MRKYVDKKDVQAKAYYTDRYYVAPQLAKSAHTEDEIFTSDIAILEQITTLGEVYVQKGHLVVYIESSENKKVIACIKDELGYDMLVEMSANDFLADRGEFEIFYELLNLTTHHLSICNILTLLSFTIHVFCFLLLK